jgi:hypothetical protein
MLLWQVMNRAASAVRHNKHLGVQSPLLWSLEERLSCRTVYYEHRLVLTSCGAGLRARRWRWHLGIRCINNRDPRSAKLLNLTKIDVKMASLMIGWLDRRHPVGAQG